MKKKINILIIIIMSFLMSLASIGYSALSKDLTLSGDLEYRYGTDIRVTSVSYTSNENGGVNNTTPNYGYDRLICNFDLPNLDSTVTYTFTVTNRSNKDMTIKSIGKSTTVFDYEFLNYQLNSKLPANSTTTIQIKFKYPSSATTTVSNYSMIFYLTYAEYVPDTIMVNNYYSYDPINYSVHFPGVSYNANKSRYLNGPIYTDTIEKVTFTTTNVVPNNVLGSWDVSSRQNGSIMAWYLDSDSNGLYEIFIGQNESHVYANSNSSSLFYCLTEVTSIENLNLLDTSYVKNMDSMFKLLKSVSSLNLSNFNTSSVTNFYSMFSGCASLTSLDVSSFNTSSATTFNEMFNLCVLLESLDLSNFNTSAAMNMSGMFDDCYKLSNLNISSFDTSNVSNMSSMFDSCNKLTSLSLTNFNTNNVTDMNSMFRSCSSLTNLDLSSFNTSKVTNMSSLFAFCRSFPSININNFDTSNVTSMSSMFWGCSSITSFNLSNFDTSKVTSMSSMFSDCSSITSIDLSNFVTANVTSMGSMFSGCSNLTTINLSSFDTTNVTSMSWMFSLCTSLVTLDISNFDTSKVTDMSHMFYFYSGTAHLKTVYVSKKFVTTAVTSSTDMFYRCSQIVGGNGTAYNSSYEDVTYARPDGWSYNSSTSTWSNDGSPGYFTLKT